MTPTRTSFADTREALHQVAEHLLAAAQFAQVGTIRLRHRPGGFGTAQALQDDRHLAVADGRLVVTQAGRTRRLPLTTLRRLAQDLGLTAGLDPSAYPPATPFRPDAPLLVDDGDARLIGRWYGLADEALRAFARSAECPAVPVIWPEHFDIAITVDAVNYGASPGDGDYPEPYLYVGPHAGAPARDAFWNARFGAQRAVDSVHSVGDAIDFFEAGRERLSAQR
jgi:hypothetical protein